MIFNKRGESSISTAVKVAISVLLGGLILVGTISIINGTVADGITDTFEQGASIEGTLNTPSAPEEIVSAKEVFGVFDEDELETETTDSVKFLESGPYQNGLVVFSNATGYLMDKSSYVFEDSYDFSFDFATSDTTEELESYVRVGNMMLLLSMNASNEISVYYYDLVNEGGLTFMCSCLGENMDAVDKGNMANACGFSGNTWAMPSHLVHVDVSVRKNKVSVSLHSNVDSSYGTYTSPYEDAFHSDDSDIVELYLMSCDNKKAICNFRGIIY